MNFKWVSEPVLLFGRQYEFKRLLTRRLLPKHRQGDWEQAYTRSGRPSPILALLHPSGVYRDKAAIQFVEKIRSQERIILEALRRSGGPTK